jgi:carboxyl-terminal processing protease
LVFVGGILAERSGRLFAPDQYPPPGVEQTFAPFWESWHLVDKYYVDHSAVDPKKMTEAAIHGMLHSLGDVGHTTYHTPKEFKELQSVLEGRMEGIGARMSFRKGQPTVEYTMANSPAREAGLRRGDVILEINGQAVSGMALDQAVSLIRGPEGETVRLLVGREGQSKPLELAIVRRKIQVSDVSWTMVPGVPVAQVALFSFGQEIDKQLNAAVATARDAGAKALVIDLRGNVGGLKDQAVAVASEFLKEGDAYVEVDAKGDRTAVPVLSGGTAKDIPICLLINEGTASSAEIFAGAIQDHARGKLIGKRTAGAGTVLHPFTLSDGSALLLAVAEWLTPKGKKIWHQGITPDFEIDLPQDAALLSPEALAHMTGAQLQKSDDKPLLKAIELLEKELKIPAK